MKYDKGEPLRTRFKALRGRTRNIGERVTRPRVSFRVFPDRLRHEGNRLIHLESASRSLHEGLCLLPGS